MLFPVNRKAALLRHGGLIHQQNGNAVAYRVDTATAGAPERFFVCRERNRLAALRHRTDQSIEKLFDNHRKYCNSQASFIR